MNFPLCIPDYSIHMTIGEFEEGVSGDLFTDHNGYACAANEHSCNSQFKFNASALPFIKKIDSITHVVWFNT
jgi:hypothetical protein